TPQEKWSPVITSEREQYRAPDSGAIRSPTLCPTELRAREPLAYTSRRRRARGAGRSAEIRLDPEAVVDPIREVRHAHDQGQLDDLVFAEVPFELVERPVTQPGARGPCQPFGVEDHRLVLLVEERALLVEGQGSDLL